MVEGSGAAALPLTSATTPPVVLQPVAETGDRTVNVAVASAAMLTNRSQMTARVAAGGQSGESGGSSHQRAGTDPSSAEPVADGTTNKTAAYALFNRPAAGAEEPLTAEVAAEGPDSQWTDLAGQVRLALARGEEAAPVEVRIRVKPAGLGDVQLVVRMQENRLTAQFTTATEGAKELIASGLPHLQQRLQGEGISLQRVEIAIATAEKAGKEGIGTQTLPWTPIRWEQAGHNTAAGAASPPDPAISLAGGDIGGTWSGLSGQQGQADHSAPGGYPTHRPYPPAEQARPAATAMAPARRSAAGVRAGAVDLVA